MLLQGAERFARAGRRELGSEAPDLEKSHESLMKAQRIIVELSTTMNPKLAPEVVERLTALYTWIYRRLIDANLTRELEPLDEAIKLIAYERETWDLLMTQNRAEKSGEAGALATQASQGSTAMRQAG